MPKKQQPSEKSSDKDNVYVIKSILAYEDRNGKDYYHVEWDGYSKEDATWEPRSNFFDPQPEIIKRMDQLKKEAKGIVNGTPAGQPSSGAAKRKRISTAASSATSKRRRTRDASPSPVVQPTSAKATSAVRKRTATKPRQVTEEEESSSEEEQAPKSPRSKTPPPTQVGRLSTESRSSGRRQQKVKVKSIRKNDAHGDLEVVMHGTDEDGEPIVVPVKEARANYAQELIDFLLGRIQFRGSARYDSP